MRERVLTRRGFLGGVAGLGAVALMAPRAGGAERGRTPNFVFILSDDQGWTGTSARMHGEREDAKSDYFLTPNLERLALGGVRFSQGYSPAALCCPTRRSLQFGQTPARQGEAGFAKRYPVTTDRLTIPRLLKAVDARYATAHFGKWDHRTDLLPEHLGYDESDGNTRNTTGNEGSSFNKQDKWTEYKELDDPKRIFSLTERAEDFIERQVRDERPFYLQVSHYAVHVDMQTRAETLKAQTARKRGDVHRIAAFAGMTADLDTGVGQLLDKLDALGIADSTYVFYMADNGAVPWIPPEPTKHLADPASLDDVGRNHPLRSGKWSLFEGRIRVPFIVRGPGVRTGAFCDVPVVGWDILPTIADLAGYGEALPEDLDGGSFRSLLEEDSRVGVKRTTDGLVFHRYAGNYAHSAIRVGDFKLVKFWKRRFRFGVRPPEGTGTLLLFDLNKDIGERHDLAEARPRKTRELHDKLMAYLERVDSEALTLRDRA